MRITTKISWNMITGKTLEHEFYTTLGSERVYPAPIARLDRSAQAADKANATTAGNLGSQLGSSAQGEQATIDPFYKKEMMTEHAFDPTQTNELLTAAEAGTGGATGALKGEAELQAARTRNPSGFTKALDEVSRNQDKAAAASSEGIAAQDVMGAKQEQQAGAAGEAGLFGENIKGQLGAMGAQTSAEQAAVEAGKSGWLQNMTGVISALGGASKGPMSYV
jgi:hypothetical protein